MRRAAGCAVAALVAGLLAGCSGSAPGMDASTATEMQTAVARIAATAATGDYPAATAGLDALQAQLDEATSAGEVESDRSTQIQSALDQVRVDLTTLGAAAPSPEASAPATVTPASPAPADSSERGPGQGKTKGTADKPKDKDDGDAEED